MAKALRTDEYVGAECFRFHYVRLRCTSGA